MLLLQLFMHTVAVTATVTVHATVPPIATTAVTVIHYIACES